MWWLVLELVTVRIALAQQKQSGQEVVNISSKMEFVNFLENCLVFVIFLE